jgi:hypothetical protein
MAPLRRTTRRRTASRTLVASQGWERVRVLPLSDHTGRLRQPTGKAGGIGMALLAALQDLSSKNDGALQNIGITGTQMVTGMQTMHGSLAHIASAFELDSQNNVPIASAKAR